MSSPAEQIKSRLNIVDVVESYLKLQKAGVNLKALCPFHREKTPSFFVSPARESWHCFGCNRGGDMFSFVMEIEGIDFPDALRILAERAGIEVRPVSQEAKSERSRLLDLLVDSKKFYEEELKKNEDVIDYLKERGMEGRTAKEFGIGFAPEGWRNLHDFLKSNGYSEEEMEKAGMIIKSNKIHDSRFKFQDNYYDRFRSRIMFPINNSAGQIAGFSGRIFKNLEVEPLSGGSTSTVPAKYINTPQTILYDKSKLLYGFDKAKMEIRKKDLCVLVEGQMDVVMSYQAGVKNAVAASGTALTENHLRAIKRLTNNLAMAFDNDEAGMEASKRGIDMAIKMGFEVRVADIPKSSEGELKDPADIIKEDKKLWEKAIKNSKHIIDFYLDSVADPSSGEGRKRIAKNVLPYIAILPSEIEKAHWVKKTAEKLGVKEASVWEDLARADADFLEEEETKESFEAKAAAPKNRLSLLKDRLAGFILINMERAPEKLKKKMKEFAERAGIDLEKVGKGVELEAEIFYGKAEDAQKEFDVLAKEAEREMIKTELDEMSGKIHALEREGKEKEIDKYLEEFHNLIKKLNEIK